MCEEGCGDGWMCECVYVYMGVSVKVCMYVCITEKDSYGYLYVTYLNTCIHSYMIMDVSTTLTLHSAKHDQLPPTNYAQQSHALTHVRTYVPSPVQTPGMTLPEELIALLAEEGPKKKTRSKKTKKAAVATGTEDA